MYQPGYKIALPRGYQNFLLEIFSVFAPSRSKAPLIRLFYNLAEFLILKSFKICYSMLMTLEEIKKLANLARIDMTESEMKEIAKDFDAILSYVGQVQEVSKLTSARQLAHPTGGGLAEKKPEDYSLCNVMREDVVTNKRGEYSEKIIAEMPDTQDGYLKVKQIL